MSHIALLGDSVFDNRLYVGPGDSVIDACAATFPPHRTVTLLAYDGSTTADVIGQLGRLPGEASHVFISCGGNDALGHLGLLQAPCSNILTGLAILVPQVQAFRSDYAALLERAIGSGREIVVCTVYDAVPGLDSATRLALSLFNDVIQREAAQFSVAVLDLRSFMTNSEDFSAESPIEPSGIGSYKIAAALERVLKKGNVD